MLEFVSKLKGLKINADVENSLSREEINVILAIMSQVFKHEGYYPEKGTFILEGQVGDKAPFKIIEAEMPSGDQKNFSGTGRSSRIIAENELKAASTQPKQGGSALVYLPNNPYIIRINTNEGRFLSAFFVDNGEYTLQGFVYMAIIRTLARLREDKNLQEACDHTFFVEVEDMPAYSLVFDFVDQLFEDCELPELKDWERWSETTEGQGAEEYFGWVEPEEEEEEEE